jgi:hypothetical protein
MKIIPFVFLMFLSASGFAQEHAPTAAQCQADERLWSSESKQATAGTGFDLTIRRYSLNELIARSKEMMMCIPVDPSRGKYESTAMLILSQIERRLTRYVQETGQAEKYDAWERQQAGQ